MNYEISKINLKGANSYLIKTDKGFILVDMGSFHSIERLEKELDNMGGNLRDTDYIFITHAHVDHVAGLKKIKKLSQADIIIQKNGIKYLKKGDSKVPSGTNLFGKILIKLGSIFSSSSFEAISPDITFEKEYIFTEPTINAKIIHTPGHTDDSSCLILDEKHCFVGDTLFNIPFTKTNYPPFANDQAELKESIKKLAATNCEYFYPGHGNTINKKDLEQTLKKINS
ncbi:MAG: MBL fold metallo-hydrolase [Candidatus Mcinerneyibacterium aminivorans]|uniref:MBL fold metallo-hydrolase n=1 Tax=Candidatus Mcinerneyibacterium aminivorans TaxID=2703815 RepID=A0A5D0MAN7_9BACT|nr:MAG: MBL fold metallo-hydrolase [Candidatus Mcinerneyibacterium aminivorans]